MKIWILISLFLCVAIMIGTKAIEFENPDLDFYIFKSFDGPLYDSDFYEPYETYGNSYSSQDNNENSSGENSEENDYTSNAKVNEGEIVATKENSSFNEDDFEELENSAESSEEKQPPVKSLKTVDPDQKKLKESGDYVSPEDVAYRLSRQKRSKKPKSEEIDYDEDEFDSYTKTYRDFVREHFGKHDEADERDEPENDRSEEVASAQAAKVNADNATQSSEENDDEESNEESDDAADDPDYQRVKKLSERETEESKRIPQYCKIIYKDDQECTICKNPKTHDTSESCSYSSSPTPKRYAFKRQKNYHSNRNDDDHEKDDVKDDENRPMKKAADDSVEEDKPKQRKNNSSSKKSKNNRKLSKKLEENPVEEKLRSYENPHYYGKYYNNDRHTNSPLSSQTVSEEDEDLSFKASEPYAASTSSDGNVDKVLESFKNRDWSKCKHKREKGITCYYCKDTDGTTQEECMYSSDMDEDNSKLAHKKKHPDSVSDLILDTKPTTQIPFLGKDDSIYKNPTSILTTFHNNQQERKLNRNKNFKINPTTNYPDTQNYGTDLSNNQQNENRRSFNVDAPITTLEYIEPKNKKTLKRMITYKVHEDESEQKEPIENKSLFYSKIIHGFKI